MANKKNKKIINKKEPIEFLLYKSDNGDIKVDVLLQNETIWLTQKQIAQLFDVTVPTINEHLKNIFSSEELRKDSVIRNFLITASDGKNYKTQFYN